jgi:hypothetical protein
MVVLRLHSARGEVSRPGCILYLLYVGDKKFKVGKGTLNMTSDTIRYKVSLHGLYLQVV